jgi:hypothetical protein
MNYLLPAYNFVQAHQTAFGYVMVAGINALPVPGTKFNFYEFLYHWVRALTPFSRHPVPDPQVPIKSEGVK